jgi:hypothetical protein
VTPDTLTLPDEVGAYALFVVFCALLVLSGVLIVTIRGIYREWQRQRFQERAQSPLYGEDHQD